MPVLKALPAHSLTRLELDVACLVGEQQSEVPQLLAGLSNLQELQLDHSGDKEAPGSWLTRIAQLSKLTQLHISGYWGDLGEASQQVLAQPLLVRQLRLKSGTWGALNLAALTQLEDLVVDSLQSGDTVLPVQLRSLQLTAVCEPGAQCLKPVTALQELQRLNVRMGFDDGATEALVRIAAKLPALQHLALTYTEASDAAVAAQEWQELPQLQELYYRHECSVAFRVYRRQVEDILAGVAAATNLTKLELKAVCVAECHEDESVDDDSCEWVGVAACRHLSGLTGLRDLCIAKDSIPPPRDALALTALTNLTRLVLNDMREGVGDVAAALIANRLTQLRHLDLRCCDLGRTGYELEGFEGLEQLTKLRVEGNPKLSSQALARVMRLPGRVKVCLNGRQRALIEGTATDIAVSGE